MRVKFAVLLLGLAIVLNYSVSSKAGPSKGAPVVVELFTSQGCYSCPPAEAYLRDLSKNPNIIALEFHVDYWDELVYGSAGKWKDVFSKPEFTRRQKIYAGNLPRGQTYTPQMVVGGNSFAVGSNQRAVGHLIAKAKEIKNPALVSISKDSQNGLIATITGHSDRALSIWLVRFLKNVTTRVRAGENKGKKLTSHNIVTKVERLSAWLGKSSQLKFTPKGFKPTEGCAILIQEDTQGPILGAALCPDNKVNG
jgi:hypothetical protein